MEKEEKIRLAGRVMVISGVFCMLVSLLLLFNFMQMKRNEPLESQAMEVLVKNLSADPGNQELMQEIRNFDLLARKAYFTAAWQVDTGALLLLIGSIIFILALKVRTDLEWKISEPHPDNNNSLLSKYKTHRWLLVSGILVIALAMGSAFLTNNYLEKYSPEQYASTDNTPLEDPVEMISLRTEEQEQQKADSVVDNSEPTVGDADEQQETESETVQEQATSAVTAKAAEGFNREDFKKNQSTFRAYMGQGISYHRNIPVKWNGSDGTGIKWKVSLDLPGYNTPVIWGDRLFLSGADESRRVVYCFDRNNGQLLWEKNADNIPGSPAKPPQTTDDTGLAAPSLTVDGKRVYALFGTGDVISFDLEGNRIWAKNLGVPQNHYGHSSSLIIWKGILVVQYDTSRGGRMLALKATDGSVVWDVQRKNMISWSSPMLLERNGKMQIVTTSDPNVAGYDLETGEELWKTAVLMGEVAPSAATLDGKVFATNEYAMTVALDPGSPDEPVWETDEYLSEVASPVAYNGVLFLATSYGVLVAYDANTGDKYWEKQYDDGFYSSPMVADGKLYIIDMAGIMHIFKADSTGTLVGEPELGEQAFALPVFADGRIYLRGKSSLYCIE